MVQFYWMMWDAQELSQTCCNVPTEALVFIIVLTVKMLELSAFQVVLQLFVRSMYSFGQAYYVYLYSAIPTSC